MTQIILNLTDYQLEILQESLEYHGSEVVPDIEAQIKAQITAKPDTKKAITAKPDTKKADFIEFLTGTLIPDLKDMKMIETAKDFETCVEYME